MYWRQVVLAGIISPTAGYYVAGEFSVTAGIGLALTLYVVVRASIATVFRTRYWLRNGGYSGAGISCPGCGQYVNRRSGDWVLTCGRCGWTAGYPGVRLLTRSVPIKQLYRSLTATRLLTLFIGVSVLYVGVVGAGGLPIDIDAIASSGGPLADTGGTNTVASPVTSTSTDNSIQVSTTTTVATTTLTEPITTTVSSTDSDRDGLLDSAETNGETNEGYDLSGAELSEKDLYLHVYVGPDVDPLTSQEQRNLRSIWRDMPVSNPSGRDGIDLHISQTRISEPVPDEISQDVMNRVREEIYPTTLSDAAQCTAYASLLIDDQSNNDYAGFGSSPGYVSIVDGSLTERYRTEYTVRVAVLTHELLHNVVGTFSDGSRHTDDGWLDVSSEEHGSNFYMSSRTASHLSDHGFATSDYYESTVCN